MPAYAGAQTSSRISLLDNFGDYDKGEQLFIFGNVAKIDPDSFLVLQIVNPNGDLCHVEQLTPLSNGLFITETIPLKGRICGITGEYQAKIFYGAYLTTATFRVTSDDYQEPSGAEYFDSATKLVFEKIQSIGEKTGANTATYSNRLLSITSEASENTITDLEDVYVDLWNDFFIEEEIFDINPEFRPAVANVFDINEELIDLGKLSFDVAKSIDTATFAAIFYYEIGDTRKAIDILNDVFVSIKNVDPIKVTSKKNLSFAQLEDSLLNLMKKTQSLMSKNVKEEIAFIFARGTAPIYSNEINELIDFLSKSRFLDVVSRKDNSLYRLVQNEWESAKSNLMNKESIEELLEHKENVDKLHTAAILLRDLDKVDRFISSDVEQNSELANLIMPEWNALSSKLELATSVDDILNSENEIENMKKVIQISSRISKAVEIANTSNINSGLADGWESLLSQVDDAQSVIEILDIVSEFDKSITELREKRNPISILKFDYQSMKNKAELQADHKNLFLIDNALKILDTAEKMEEGNPSVNRIDRIEVLLTWVSEKAPEIKTELNSYSKDAYKVRAADILQRAKSIENLTELGSIKKRFLPGYTDYTDSVKQRINESRDMVIENDLDAADNLVRELFSEWRQVSAAYANDPFGSEVGYSADELERIEYREKMNSFSKMVTNFYNVDFEPHLNEYQKMVDDTYELIDYGNFIDANSKVNQIGKYLSENLILNSEKILYDISYDQEKAIWVISGAVDKPRMDRRENLYLTVYNTNGNIHSQLEFTDTRQGQFYTQWEAPTKPGLYIVMLQYQDSKASQIVNIEEKLEHSYSDDDSDLASLSREFEELRIFIENFGNGNVEKHKSKFDDVIERIKVALSDRDWETANEELSDLKKIIERYLPLRSRNAVIEANYEHDKLYLSGSVLIGNLDFPEDLFVDIFDQQGNHVDEISFKHEPEEYAGKFNQVISKPFTPGIYVVQLQHHDLYVSDFFQIN